MSVVVYTTPTCGFCHQAKSYLQQRGVPFIEIDVSRNQWAATEMVQLSGQQGVPVITIDEQVILGFDRPAVDRSLMQRMSYPPKLGAAIADAAQIARNKGVELPAGAYIGRINPRSAAHYAHLQVRDVIIKLADQLVQSEQDVHRILSTLRNNSVVSVSVWRDGKQIDANVPF